MSDADKPAPGNVRLYNKGSRHIEIYDEKFPPKTTGEFSADQAAYLRRLFPQELIDPAAAVKNFTAAPMIAGTMRKGVKSAKAPNPAIAANAARKAAAKRIEQGLPPDEPAAAAKAPTPTPARQPAPAAKKEGDGFTLEAARAAGYTEAAIEGMAKKYGVTYVAPIATATPTAPAAPVVGTGTSPGASNSPPSAPGTGATS